MFHETLTKWPWPRPRPHPSLASLTSLLQGLVTFLFLGADYK